MLMGWGGGKIISLGVGGGYCFWVIFNKLFLYILKSKERFFVNVFTKILELVLFEVFRKKIYLFVIHSTIFGSFDGSI